MGVEWTLDPEWIMIKGRAGSGPGGAERCLELRGMGA